MEAYAAHTTESKRRRKLWWPVVPAHKHESISLMTHHFCVGQLVQLEPKVLRPCAPGPYEIRYLVPISEREPGDPSYRIKSPSEKHERVVTESDLVSSSGKRARP